MTTKFLVLFTLSLSFNGWTQTDSIALQPSNSVEDEITISFVGNSDFMKAYAKEAPFGANAGIGMVFYKKSAKIQLFQETEIDMSLSMGNSDTIFAKQVGSRILNQDEFGHYLLLPHQSRQSANLHFNTWFGQLEKYPWTKVISGIDGKLNVSNVVWYLHKSTEALTGVAFQIGLFHDFMPAQVRREKGYSLTVGLNYAYRSISGSDVVNIEGQRLHEAILCQGKTRFHGTSLTFGFRLKNIRAGVQILSFPNKECFVPGFTRTQLVTGLSFVGGFPILVRD